MGGAITIGFECDALTSIAASLATLARIHAHAVGWPPAASPVGSLTARLLREGDDMLIYEFDLPQLDKDNPRSADVVRGELRLLYDGAPQAAIETATDATVSPEVRIPQGAVVAGSFTFIDDAGLASENPVQLVEFTASDTIPPSDPVGGFGARLVREEADA